MDNYKLDNISIELNNKEHFLFLNKEFKNIYISEYDFLNRKDLFSVSLYNNDNELIAVSTCRISFTKKTNTPVVRIMFVLVDNKYRGNNLNYQLNKFLVKYCNTLNCKKIVCNIKKSNIASIKTFIKSGFFIYNKKKMLYKNGEVKLFLIKKW